MQTGRVNFIVYPALLFNSEYGKQADKQLYPGKEIYCYKKYSEVKP